MSISNNSIKTYIGEITVPGRTGKEAAVTKKVSVLTQSPLTQEGQEILRRKIEKFFEFHTRSNVEWSQKNLNEFIHQCADELSLSNPRKPKLRETRNSLLKIVKEHDVIIKYNLKTRTQTEILDFASKVEKGLKYGIDQDYKIKYTQIYKRHPLLRCLNPDPLHELIKKTERHFWENFTVATLPNQKPIEYPNKDTLSSLDELSERLKDFSNLKSTDFISIKTVRTKNGEIVSFSSSAKWADLDRGDVFPKMLSLFRKISKLFWNPAHLDNLKELKAIYESFLEKVQWIPIDSPLRERYKKVVGPSFEKVHELYERYRTDSSVQAMIYKNDLLEAISVAVKPGGLNDVLGTNIERVKADPIQPFQGKIKPYYIPLFRMEDLELVNQIMKRDYPDLNSPPTLQQIQANTHLQPYLLFETSSLKLQARLMRWLYKNRLRKKAFNNFYISNQITKVLGKKMRKAQPAGEKRTRNILKFFNNLGISLSTQRNGRLYSYREVFEKEFRDEISADAAFQRGLNSESLKMHMQEAHEMKERGFKPIISNSYNRLRFFEIPAGHVKTSYTIDGKSLNATVPHTFTLQNMLGHENDVDTSFSEKRGAINPKNRKEADSLYLQCLTNMVNQHSAQLVIQRLAPDDIHRYVESVGGKVLNLEEASQKLETLLKQTANPQEREQLKLLQAYYQNHPQDNRGAIEIRGTQMSVSTLATQRQAPLSQNDRKPLLIEHEDGTISIHTYIGAIGVNNVKITARPGSLKIGNEIGSMGFGNDETGKRMQWQTMATKEDSIKLRDSSKEPLEIGANRGVFHRDGSTVVSLYFNMTPIAKLEEASKHLKYKDSEGNIRTIEILSHMGDVIGTLKT